MRHDNVYLPYAWSLGTAQTEAIDVAYLRKKS